MRQKVIAGNWKMFKTVSEAEELVLALKKKVKHIAKTKIIICPPATNLSSVNTLLLDSDIYLGAQNLFWEEEGAYTGEISAKMLLSTGAQYVIIGHSERRQYFGETEETVNKRIKTALKYSLRPILCVGEMLEQREAGITNKVVKEQLSGALDGISNDEIMNIIIAYEPVWAIGTGKTATPQQAEEVHAYIRGLIEELYEKSAADRIIIQYGGSVKPDNAAKLLSQPDIDGALVGGACLQADSFSAIIAAAEAQQNI